MDKGFTVWFLRKMGLIEDEGLQNTNNDNVTVIDSNIKKKDYFPGLKEIDETIDIDLNPIDEVETLENFRQLISGSCAPRV